MWRLTLGLGLQFCALEVLKGQLLALRPTVPRMPGVLCKRDPQSGRLQSSAAVLHMQTKASAAFSAMPAQQSQGSVLRLPDSWAGRLTAGESFWVGGLARGLAAVATCPVTVVKTQMEYAGYGTKHQVRSVLQGCVDPRSSLHRACTQ